MPPRVCAWICQYHSPASSCVVRRVWPLSSGAASATDGASAGVRVAVIAGPTVPPLRLCTPSRAYTHAGTFAASGMALAGSNKKIKRRAAPGADGRTASTAAATKKQRKQRSAPHPEFKAVVPTLSVVKRVVHLSDAVQEWVMLRCWCRWKRRQVATARDASSAPSGLVSERCTAAGSPTGESRGCSSVPMSGSDALPAEVSAAERAQLLSTLANEPSAYPQLYTLFYPQGHASAGDALGTGPAPPAEVARWEWCIEGTPALVRSETLATELLTLLHVHHQLLRQSRAAAELHEAVWSAYVLALQTQLEADVEQPTRHASTSVALVLRTLTGVHRSQLNRRTSTAGNHRLTKEKQMQSQEEMTFCGRVRQVLLQLTIPTHALLRRRDEAAGEERGRPASPKHNYGDATALLLTAAVSAVAVETAAALSLATASATAVGASSVDAELVVQWTAWRDDARARLTSHLDALKSSVHDCDMDRAAALFVDVLGCLRWTEELGIVLPPVMGSCVEEACEQTLFKLCRCAETVKGAEYFEHICTPEVMEELRRLSPERTTYTQVITNICTAAALYLKKRPQRVPQLVEQVEKKHRDAAAKKGISHSLPARPPLHSPLANLLYAMLCAGFPPESLLTCSLCVSLPPGDVIEVVRAVNRFSASCATAPLPVRTRAVLVDQVCAMLTQCNRDSHRVVFSSTDELGEEGATSQGGEKEAIAATGGASQGTTPKEFHLKQRMADGAKGGAAQADLSAVLLATAMPSPQSQAAATDGQRRTRRGRKTIQRRTALDVTDKSGLLDVSNDEGTGTSRASADAASTILTPAVHRRQVNYLLFVGIEALVECLLRGDAAAVETLTQGLLPLLQREGREAALADALEVIWEGFRSRLTDMGCYDVGDLATRSPRSFAATVAAAGQSSRPPAPPVALSEGIEKSLALLPTLFLPRLTESAVKLLRPGLLRTGAEGSLGTSKAAGSHGHSALSSHPPLSAAFTAPISVDALREVALRLSTTAILCGMPADTFAQLTALHNMLHKSHGTSTGVGAGRPEDPAAAVASAYAVVERLERLLSQLFRQSQGLKRHPHSAHARNSGLVVYQLLATYIASTATVANSIAQLSGSSTAAATTTQQRYRHYLLTVVHLLYRLRTEYTVVVEPAALRLFRIEVFDSALTAVMCIPSVPSTPSSHAEATPPLQMPLTTLTEVMVVMCVAESVQHVSSALVRGVVAAVEQHLKTRTTVTQPPKGGGMPRAALSTSTADAADSATGVLATQLLCAAATLCLRADDALTSMLLQLLDLLSPMLTISQTITVLQRLHATGAPLPAPSVQRLIERLVEELHEQVRTPSESGSDAATATRDATIVTQRITILHTLSAIQKTAEEAVDDDNATSLLQLLRTIPYGPLLYSLLQPQQLTHRRYTVGECGALVEVVARLIPGEVDAAKLGVLQRNPAASVDGAAAERTAGAARKGGPKIQQPEVKKATAVPSASEVEVMRLLPRTLAVYVLQAVQLPYNVHDIPLLLRGYAALSGASQLQQQVLRSFISHTMRAAPTLTPEEIVLCVEAYCAGGVYHQQLYGVLLGRVADMGRKFSLELSVRLLRCGTQSGNVSVRTVCVTAVQPIFSAQVRGLLQSDPHMLVSVASTALAILNCLRDCFPHDNIGSAVLANVARYHHDASLSVVKATLELAERRGSTDYDVVHILARHCTERVLPTCSPADLGTLSFLLIACGLRTAAVMEAIYKRLSEVVHTMQAHGLTRLAQGLLRASVDVDTTVMTDVCGRIVELAGESTTGANVDVATGTPLTMQQVCVLLQLLRSVAGRVMTTVMKTVDVLLSYAERLAVVEDQDGAGEPKAAPSGAAEKPAHDAYPSSYRPPQPLKGMTLREVEVLLRCCIDLSNRPKQFHRLTHGLADYTAYVMSRDASSHAGSAVGSDGRLRNDAMLSASLASARFTGMTPATGATPWQTDLILLVDLSSLLIRLGETAHPVIQQLFERQYDRRGTLLQRALLVKTTKQSLEAVGRDAHPALYKLVVDGELF